MRLSQQLTSIIVVTLVLSFRLEILSSSSEVPYIYYYSSQLSGFVIEKADGSDSRILTSYLVPESYSITGPGWSPSGNWLAWTLDASDGASVQQQAAYVVNREGGQPIPILEEKKGSSRITMYWSPSTDILLINNRYANYDEQGNQTESLEELFLYDPKKNERIAVYAPWGVYTEWTPDSESIALYNNVSLHNSPEMKIISGTDNITNRDVFLPTECPEGSFPRWSNDSKVAYVASDNDSFLVENINKNEVHHLPLPTGIIRFIDWSPDSEYLVVYTSNTCQDTHYDLWLISLIELSSIQILNDVNFQLPEKLPLTQFHKFSNEYDFDSLSSWDKNSDQFFAISVENKVYLINVLPFQISEINSDVQIDGNLLTWASLKPDRLFMGTQIPSKIIYSYESSQNHLESHVISTDSIKINYLSVSMPGDYIGYSNYDSMSIINLNTGNEIDIDLINSKAYTVTKAEIFWHFSQPWFFATGIVSDIHTRLVDIIGADANLQREIGICTITPSCFGWLPISDGL